MKRIWQIISSLSVFLHLPAAPNQSIIYIHTAVNTTELTYTRITPHFHSQFPPTLLEIEHVKTLHTKHQVNLQPTVYSHQQPNKYLLD